MMKRMIVSVLALALLATSAQAVVFLNEIYINPTGSGDNNYEFIELLGTPGKKLDGYAIAFVSGAQRKIHPDSPIPPNCSDDPSLDTCTPEIDEFFSLDGLELGGNGILVLGIGIQSRYGTLVADSNFRRWVHTDDSTQRDGIWNGWLDTPGKLQNDGSNTILLLRNRPGATSGGAPGSGSCPSCAPLDLRWGKDIDPDTEVIAHDPLDPDSPPAGSIQYGNGAIDKGAEDGLGGYTEDMRGWTTLADVSDDLEVVDELSYEHDQGQEYDFDSRDVDIYAGPESTTYPTRKVHALDDPQGLNPDCVTRVDYRTKGPGWEPRDGGTGEYEASPGVFRNWQDTATEQWIRGESVFASSGGYGPSPQWFYDNSANTNPDAIQPYATQVPEWLLPGLYQWTSNHYQIMAGQVNPHATPFIPGDSDRDGDCDQDDIDKIAAVFGDDDWIFSNSFADAPEGKDGDPATQTRPWDVDGNGQNGIEASDLQWSLNFQGDTTGRIQGVTYDASATNVGVYLNANASVVVDVTASYVIPSGRTLTTLQVGDTVDMTVSAEVTGGANATAGQENGVMQYIQDVALSTAGILKVTDVTSLGSFAETRAALETLEGTAGDEGVSVANGYTTSFTQGLGGAASMYKVTFEAIAEGTTDISIAPAAMPKFAASTPAGVKVGHTDHDGNPASSNYPVPGTAIVTAPSGTPPTITAAESVKTHGVFGDFGIDVMAAGATEGRNGGATSVVVTFDIPVQVVGGTSAVDTAGNGSVANVVASSNVVTVTLAGTLDETTLTMTFPGIADANDAGATCTGSVSFALKNGNVQAPPTVNIFDLLSVRNNLGQPITASNFNTDVQVNGVVNIFDLLAVRNNLD